jgi:transposase
MSKTRRVFSTDYKAKVVLEALKEKNTIEVVAKKYEHKAYKEKEEKCLAL